MTVYRCLFVGLMFTALVQVFYYYPRMPLVVASHFDSAGAANGWSSRNLFFGIYLAMIGLVFAVFILVPRWRINHGKFGLKIPNRDYWLAPERQLQTLEFFRRSMMVMGVVHLLLVIASVQLAILANLGQDTHLDAGIYWALGLYFIFLIAWILNFHMHFRKP